MRIWKALAGVVVICFSTPFIWAADQAPQPEVTSEKAFEANFDREEVGKLPSGWSARETDGTGKKGRWSVIADPTAPTSPAALELKTEAESGTYNLIIAEKSSFKDLDLRVRVKANSGKEDQGGGLIWRCKDENNYYICRINPLEGNLRVYKVVDGKRKQLESTKLDTASGKWYEVQAMMVGDLITCFVDGAKHLEAKDDAFKDAGMIGLWTKADASSSFDDLIVSSPKAAHEEKDGAKPAAKHDDGKDEDDDDDGD